MMSSEDGAFVIGLLIGLMIGALIGTVTLSQAQPDYRQQAIEHGYAEYNSTTGAWQWIEKAEKQNED